MSRETVPVTIRGNGSTFSVGKSSRTFSLAPQGKHDAELSLCCLNFRVTLPREAVYVDRTFLSAEYLQNN